MRGCERRRRAGIANHRQYNNGWHTAMDLPIYWMCRKRSRAALLRQESRGAQFREDFPAKVAKWGNYNIVVGALQTARCW
ncbi:MAG: hypothetical protein WKF37_07800 [Bryobacteraceae bacterium]